MLRSRWCLMRLVVIVALACLQCAAIGVMLGQAETAALRESDARMQERQKALSQRVERLETEGSKRQQALDDLRREVAVIQSEISSARWLLGVLLAGVAGLLGDAGFRLHLYRRTQNGRHRHQ